MKHVICISPVRGSVKSRSESENESQNDREEDKKVLFSPPGGGEGDSRILTTCYQAKAKSKSQVSER